MPNNCLQHLKTAKFFLREREREKKKKTILGRAKTYVFHALQSAFRVVFLYAKLTCEIDTFMSFLWEIKIETDIHCGQL